MNSRERLLSAMSLQPVDHIPLLLRFWSLGGEQDHIPFEWREEVKRVENTTALGLDDTILLQPPLGYVEEYTPEDLPAVTSHCTVLPEEAGENYPLLQKVYHTPAGDLQTVIRLTEDWPHGTNLNLFDDYNLSRLKEPLIKSLADLDKLRYLLADPSADQMECFRRHSEVLRQHAQRLGVVLDGGWVALGDAVMWLCGMERILYGQMDEPEFIEQVLETVHQWEMKRIQVLIEAGIDVLVHMGWYESTDFWTPKSWRKLIKPRLEEEIALAHRHGVKYRYIITKSWKSYRQDFLDMGIDCITGVDPVQDKLDLEEVAAELGGKLCLMGGVNSAVMLSQWEEAQIHQAVERAVATLAPKGGFILFPVDAVFNTQPWDKIEMLMQAWKRVRER